jgi:phospholipase C
VRDEKSFPDFALLEPKYFGPDENDDHPPNNIMKGEKLIADAYNALRSNPDLWNSSLYVVLFD